MKLTHTQYHNHKTYKSFKDLIITDERINQTDFDKIDNKFYYIYRISNLINNKHYYGSRVSDVKPIEDLGINYFSSSTKNTHILENADSFRFKIVKIFDNNGDKKLYESFIHYYFNVRDSSKFWNKINQTPFGFDTTGVSPWNKGLTKNDNPNIVTGSEKMIETRKTNDSYKSGKLKEVETRNKKDKDGLNSYDKAVAKRQTTISTPSWKDTIGKEQKKKEKLTKLIKDENGLNSNERGALKLKERYLANCERFNILKDGIIISKNVTKVELNKLHGGLINSTQEKKLGNNKISLSKLKRFNKEYMFGWYAELIIV